MLIMLGSRGNTWIEKTVRKLRIQENVKLLPKLKREEVYILMANCKLVLMPSISPEAFGRVPAEANLLGTPAIVSNRGALPEIIVNGVTGFVTEPSIEAFTRAVNDALSTEWDRQQIISTAEARFNPQRIAEVFLHLFKKFA
jgi:glycosyltransferase involved in cell wall biosynthesis